MPHINALTHVAVLLGVCVWLGCQERPARPTAPLPPRRSTAKQIEDQAVVPLGEDERPNDVVDSAYGLTRMHIAARDGNVPYLKYLIQHGGDVNAKSVGGRGVCEETPMHWAKTAEVVALLLARDADRDAPTALGQTALHSLAFRNRQDAVAALLQAGAGINTRDSYLGWNAVGWACSGLATDRAHDNAESRLSARKSLIRYLVQHGGDVNNRNNDGETVLHLVVKAAEPEFLTLLIRLGADREIASASGTLPIDLARNHNLPEITALLEK